MIRAGTLPDDYVVTYRYDMYVQDEQINVAFMNLRRFSRTGADHSAPSSVRHDFAQIVLQHFQSHCPPVQALWYDLPEHPYLNFLRNNDFEYHEYSVVFTPMQANMHTAIMIRPSRSIQNLNDTSQ